MLKLSPLSNDEENSELLDLKNKTILMLKSGMTYYHSALDRNSISDLHHALLYIKASCSELIKYGLQNTTAAYWCSLVYSRMGMDYYDRSLFERALSHAELGFSLLEKMDFCQVDSEGMRPDDHPESLKIRLYFVMGSCLLKLNNIEKSDEYIRKGLELAPDHPELTAIFHEAHPSTDRFQRNRTLDRYTREEDGNDLKHKLPQSYT